MVRGDLSAPTCTTCHGNHGATPPGFASVANVCSTCHVFQAQLFDSSPHKEAFVVSRPSGLRDLSQQSRHPPSDGRAYRNGRQGRLHAMPHRGRRRFCCRGKNETTISPACGGNRRCRSNFESCRAVGHGGEPGQSGSRTSQGRPDQSASYGSQLSTLPASNPKSNPEWKLRRRTTRRGKRPWLNAITGVSDWGCLW